MKKCLLCGTEIPNWITIDGVQKNISKRTYCVECSPWGQHNTKQLNKPVNSQIPETKICVKCKQEKPIHEFRRKGKYRQSYCKPCMYKYQIERWIEIKKKAIEYKGGICIRCGYNKCYGALKFHHRDPEEKDAMWHQLRLRSWKAIQYELDKCDLLCGNCHDEVHHEIYINKKQLSIM